MPRVLLIDDDQALLSLMRQAFAKIGFSPFTAENGAEGVDLYHSVHPDLVVTDIIMPDREGISVVMEVKNGLFDTRLIAISGGGEHGRSSYLRWAKELGADRVLQKPFRISELLIAAKDLVGDRLETARSSSNQPSEPVGSDEFFPSIALNS